MKALLTGAVIQNKVEAARHADDELVQISMRMGPAVSAAGYIVQIVDPLNFEGDVLAPFNEGQVPAPICYFGQIYAPAVG